MASLDPNKNEIKSELGKVMLLFKATIKGKRKLDSFDQLEGNQGCLTSSIAINAEPLNAIVDQRVNDGGMCFSVSTIPRKRDVDSPCIRQRSEEPVVGEKPLPCLNAYPVTEDKHGRDISGIPYVSIAPPNILANIFYFRLIFISQVLVVW